MPQVVTEVSVADTFSEAAQKSLQIGLRRIGTIVAQEASVLAVHGTNRPTDQVYEEDVREALELYLSPPGKWDKLKAVIRAGATFLGGVVTTALSIFAANVELTDSSLPWVVVGCLTGSMVIASMVLMSYRGA